MAFQDNATDFLVAAYPGDSAGIHFYPDYVASATTVAGVTVGTFVWYVLGSNTQVDQVKGSNTQLAGFVFRSNTNISSALGLTTNATLVIQQGNPVEFSTRGEFKAILTTILGTDPILYGAPVYVSNTTGALAADGGGTLTGYTKTNFVFASPSAELVANALVTISNVRDVIGV